MPSNDLMKVISQIRRERLQQLLDERQLTRAAFNEVMGRDRRDATLSQILSQAKSSRSDKERKLGDDQARAIEVAFALPTGWLDRDPELDRLADEVLQVREASATYSLWPFARVPLRAIHELSPEQLQHLEDQLLLTLQLVAPSHQAATGTGPAR